MNEIYGSSFLLKYFDLLTNAWVKEYSLAAVPPLRMGIDTSFETQQFNRDIVLLAMLTGSILSVALCYWLKPTRSCFALQLISAFAFYRCIDVFIAVIRTGVFFSFRGNIQINKEPSWRVRWVLLGVIFNYIELIMWFAIIYFQIALKSPNQFTENITYIHQALNLSFSTMTTIGYGKYEPNQMFSTILTLLQALTGIMHLTLAISSLLALLTKANNQSNEILDHVPIEQASWIKPIGTFIPLCILFYLFWGSNLY